MPVLDVANQLLCPTIIGEETFGIIIWNLFTGFKVEKIPLLFLENIIYEMFSSFSAERTFFHQCAQD